MSSAAAAEAQARAELLLQQLRRDEEHRSSQRQAAIRLIEAPQSPAPSQQKASMHSNGGSSSRNHAPSPWPASPATIIIPSTINHSTSTTTNPNRLSHSSTTALALSGGPHAVSELGDSLGNAANLPSELAALVQRLRSQKTEIHGLQTALQESNQRRAGLAEEAASLSQRLVQSEAKVCGP